MFSVNKNDMSIYCTRGDSGTVYVTATADGLEHEFRAGDVVRLKVFEKKGCDCVVLQREIVVEANTVEVPIHLSGAHTKIGGIIHKPMDFWYEVELNPYTVPETIIGYDEDGPKVFRLFPEGDEAGDIEEPQLPSVTVEDIVAETLARAQASGAFDGEDGQDGEDGKDGADGYTPVKGTDYYTDADRAEMVQAVLAAMPYYAGETGDIT